MLYIDRENGSNLIAHRREVLGIPDTPKLRYWGRWVSLPFPGIGSNELVEYAEAVHPLIIFDSLVRCHDSNENDNTEMARVMDGFVGLARKGATVVVLHHAGNLLPDERKAEPVGSCQFTGTPRFTSCYAYRH